MTGSELTPTEKVLREETSRRERTREKGAVCYEYEHDGEKRRVRLARDIDPSYNDAITVSEPDARSYADPLPEYPLPSTGEMLEDCGERFAGNFCPGCGKPHEVGRTCRNPDCPRCWQSWAFHRGISMAAKLQSLAKYRPDGVFKHHITVSLDDSTRFNSKDPLKRGTEAVKALLAQVDIDTGYLVYHPYRIAPEYRGTILGHESGEGDMSWKDILEKVESDAWTWEAVREEFLVYAPHFHVICLSEFVDCTSVAQIEEQTGGVIHRITTRREDGNEKSIADLEELCKVTAYSLSHAGIAPESERQTHRTAIRPFGQVANFEAYSNDEKDVSRAMRAVASKVLGLDLPPRECNEAVPCRHRSEDVREGLPIAANALTVCGPSGSDGGFASESNAWEVTSSALTDDRGMWNATAGVVPSDLEVVADGGAQRCGEKLVPIWRADEYLGDLAWIEGIESRHGEERIHELRRAVESWRDMGEPRPTEVVPPDE